MVRVSDVVPLLQPALVQFITFLTGTEVEAGEDAEALAKRYADAKSKLGRDTVAAKIGMNEAELTMFDAALREGVRRATRLAPDAPPFEQRNATIAVLRLLSWLETIADRRPELGFSVRLPGQDDEVGRKQVRALELIIRSLITEKYEDQPALIARLKDLLSEKVVQQWLTAADRGDVLSGTTFSELSSLFVSTQEYPNYDPLYRDTPLLSLLKEKRVTIRNYLDDIRRIRNVLAHNKRVTPAQMALLNMYYEELVEPLQEAHDQGRTAVNPDLYLDVSAEELDGYFGKLSDDVKAVKDDIADLRVELGGKLDTISADTSAIRQSTTQIETGTRAANSKLRMVLAAVAGVAVLAAVILYVVFGTSQTTEQIAGDARTTRDTADRIEGKTDDISASQQRTEAAIADIAAGFKQIDKNGGVIADASKPEEHYHNAIVHEARGEAAEARKSYLAFAGFDLDAIDVYDRFARLLRVQDGRAGAREVFGDLASRLKAPAIKLVYAMQFEDAERTKRMEDFLAQNPDYGPGAYLLSLEYSEERTGGQSLADKQRELALLNQFLHADAQGTLIRHFVDQQVLGAWLDRARQRVRVLEPQLQGTRAEPTMVQSNTNGGWIVAIMLPEAALDMFYRVGETGDFVDAGHNRFNDPRTGKPMPNTTISLPPGQQPTKIHIKYTNANGQVMGPFALDFVTTSALIAEQKAALEMIWTSWITMADMPGGKTLLYYTMLVSYRCGIDKAAYSIGSDRLDKAFDLPPCDETKPMEVPPNKMPYFEIPPGTKSVWVKLSYRDGTQSAAYEFKR